MALAIVFGALFLLAGVVLYRDLFGAATALIANVTSKNLGSLAPGYAASPAGMRVYALLLAGIGLALLGLGLTPIRPAYGPILLAFGVLVFLVASVLIVIGEVRTFRALPKRPGG